MGIGHFRNSESPRNRVEHAQEVRDVGGRRAIADIAGRLRELIQEGAWMTDDIDVLEDAHLVFALMVGRAVPADVHLAYPCVDSLGADFLDTDKQSRAGSTASGELL